MQFLFGFGLFYDIWAPIIEIVINLTIAIWGGYMWGLPGVLLGGLTSQILIVGIWKPYFLFKKGFKEPAWNYWKHISVYCAGVILPALFIILLLNPLLPFNAFDSWTYWILCAGIDLGAYSLISIILLYYFTSGMRSFVHRFIKIKL